MGMRRSYMLCIAWEAEVEDGYEGIRFIPDSNVVCSPFLSLPTYDRTVSSGMLKSRAVRLLCLELVFIKSLPVAKYREIGATPPQNWNLRVAS
jgi:hypothetical protein